MTNNDILKVLVVDDTVVYRKIVSDVLAGLPDVQVVGTAHNGKAALLKIKTLQPDLLTLDIEMPEVNGLEVLSQDGHPGFGRWRGPQRLIEGSRVSLTTPRI